MSSSDATPVTEMTRDELEAEVDALRERVGGLEDDLEWLRQNTATEQTMTVLLRNLLDADIHPNDDPATHFDAVAEFGEVVRQFGERLETHNDRLAQLEEDSKHSGKTAKVRDIVEFATNKADHRQASVFVTPADIKGATGVTRRYAYDLVDELPNNYSFILDRSEVGQYGSLEIDHDQRTKGVVVVVDEGVHEELGGVNKFTTRTGEEGRSR